MVGQRTLTPFIVVRVHVPDPINGDYGVMVAPLSVKEAARDRYSLITPSSHSKDGLCGGLKILRYWFDTSWLHQFFRSLVK
jgi:hypothetical protein